MSDLHTCEFDETVLFSAVFDIFIALKIPLPTKKM